MFKRYQESLRDTKNMLNMHMSSHCPLNQGEVGDGLLYRSFPLLAVSSDVLCVVFSSRVLLV